MRAQSDLWSRFSGEKLCMEHGCYSSIPAGMGDAGNAAWGAAGAHGYACPTPLCPKNVQHQDTESSSWLRGSQASPLTPAKPHFMELFICFLWISTALCAQTCLLTAGKWPARKAVPHCTDGVKSVKKMHLSFYSYLVQGSHSIFAFPLSEQ